MKVCAVCAVSAMVLVGSARPAAAQESAVEGVRSPVGMAGRMSVDIPGTLLKPRPIDDNSPIILRVVTTRPADDAVHYELEFLGLDPGRYDLKNFLMRVDASSTDAVPSLPVTIVPTLPPGQILPTELDSRVISGVGGYRLLVLLATIGWIIGLLLLVFVKRRPSDASDDVAVVRKPTLAERLKPLLDAAVNGDLSPEKRSRLELALVSLWRRRLGLRDADVADSLRQLRQHEDAGPLMRQLEAWLHRPGGGDAVDVAALLRPYQTMRPEDIPELSDVEAVS